jgi:hypothetical protein
LRVGGGSPENPDSSVGLKSCQRIHSPTFQMAESSLFTLNVKFILIPIFNVGDDVSFYSVKFFLVPDDVVMKAGLPVKMWYSIFVTPFGQRRFK